MPTWIVVRHTLCADGRATESSTVVGSIRATEVVDARIAAHSRWMVKPGIRLELIPVEEANPAQVSAAAEAPIDLEEERLRLESIFDDRLIL